MGHAQSRRLSQGRLDRLLSGSRTSRSTGPRIEFLSRHFLGQPYQSNPLVGSATESEVFTVSLDSFDCVTYIETILALALSSKAGDFTEWLRKIRYQGGRVAWNRRNHYMTGWIRSNISAGALQRVSAAGLPKVVKDRTLDSVPGLAAVRTRRAAAQSPWP